METMPTRNISGKCEGECRDRVMEGEKERQREIESQPYDTPSPNSPSWTKRRNDPPGALGGRV